MLSMGNLERAKRISSKGTNGAMKAVGYKVFSSCGNCVLRISCLVEGMLKSGGHPDPLGKMILDLEGGCIKPKNYKGIGILAKNVAIMGNSECSCCNKFEICVNNILNYRKIEDEERRRKIHTQARMCISCPDLDKCCQKYTEEFRIRSYKLILKFFVIKFRKCKIEEMQKVSLDLDSMEKASQVINISSSVPEIKCDKKH